jgi:hypothetical protein
MNSAPLILRATDATPDVFHLVEDARKVGRVHKIKKQWVWDIDWFGLGLKLVRDRRAAGLTEPPDLLFKSYWQWVVRTGVERYGTGGAPTRDRAMADFNAAWASVTKLGADATAAQNSDRSPQ